jgi:CO2 hydration protein
MTAPHPLASTIERLLRGEALLQDSPTNVLEVVGILHSYGIVLDAYSNNLNYIAEHQFLRFFPFFKYFNGDVSLGKLLKHWQHDRINFEYAEYCMKAMFWHGGGRYDTYLDSPEFVALAKKAIRARFASNPIVLSMDRLFPEFLLELVRQLAYYRALGQFWRIMSDMFMSLSAQYDRRKIKTIPQVVQHIQDALVAAASSPIEYRVELGGITYDIVPRSAKMTFLMDAAVPYVEAVFFRGTPFSGIVSYNAQAAKVPIEQGAFAYGALYADPLPVGGAGIPPTLLMQDMRHFLPDYLHQFYEDSLRHEDDLLVKICQTFQKSMYCVTTAAIRGLAPHPLESPEPAHRSANAAYLTGWMDRLVSSRLGAINSPYS